MSCGKVANSQLKMINEEEFGLPRMNSFESVNEWNKNIDFDWDDFKVGKENNERLYQILNHPRKVYSICDKTGEALKFGKPIQYKRDKVQHDEEFYKVADSIYGFDAMQFALKSYLETCESEQKKKKPPKKKITKMKLYTPKKAKSKSEKKKLIEVQLTQKMRKSENIDQDVNLIPQYESIIQQAQLDRSDRDKVQFFSTKQKSKVSDWDRIERVKEDNCKILTTEKKQSEKYNKRKTSTLRIESTQKMQKSQVNDSEMIERAEEDSSEKLTPEKIPFEKFNERRTTTPHFQLTQNIQKSKGSDCELMEGAKEDIFEMLFLEKRQLKKFNESKTSTPRVELTQTIQKSEVSDWELIERVNENNCEMLTPKKRQLKKITERTKSTPYVESTQTMQTSKVSDWEMMETDKIVPYQFKEFAPICKIPKKSVAASKSEKKKLLEVQLTENYDQDVNLIQQYESIINQAELDRGDRDKVQFFSTNHESKQNCYEKLPVINEEEFGLPRMNSFESVNEWNKNIDFDWDDFKVGKENNERLYQILNHPRKVYSICDKTGEALKFGKPIQYKRDKVQHDEEFYKVADSIYGFDAMQFALKSYLETCESEQKKKKPPKKKITKMKLYTPKKAKSKSEKKKLIEVQLTQKMRKSENIDQDVNLIPQYESIIQQAQLDRSDRDKVQFFSTKQKSKVSDWDRIERVKEDNCKILTTEKKQSEKYNKRKTSTLRIESTQKMQKSQVNDSEMIERAEEDSSEKLTPEKIPFEKFNERRTTTPHFQLTQNIQKSKGSDCELMEGAKEDIFEMLFLEKRQLKKFNESKTSTPRVELTQTIQKSEVSDWELIERVNENNCEMLTPKKRQLKKITERTKSTPYVESTQTMQTSKVSDWEMMETDKIVPYQFKEFAPICKIPKKSVAASKSEKKKLLEVQLTENYDQDVNLIQQYESIINQAELDRGDRDKVQFFSTNHESKQNCYEKLPVINEEEFGLPRMNSFESVNEWNKNIDFDWDDFKVGKENNERLYQILNHPRKVYSICDKTGEALKFGKPIQYKRDKVQHDEEFYKVADSIYGFDAMHFALKSYLETCESEQKKKKPHKKKITKMKLYTPKKAKSELEKKKYAKIL